MTANQTRQTEWASWLRAAMEGDSQAYHSFLTAIAPHLRKIARRRCDEFGVSSNEAEDVVQEVLLTIHLKRGTWDPSRPLAPWMSTIVRNKLVDSLRRRGKHVEVPLEDVVATLEVDERISASNRIDIEKFLSKLREPQRTIVQAISIEGESVRETASRLNMSEGAVRVALHRALKGLAALYSEKET